MNVAEVAPALILARADTVKRAAQTRDGQFEIVATIDRLEIKPLG